MGDVAVSLRVMPSGTDVNLERIKKEIRAIVEEKARLKSLEEKPIAFGLSAVEVLFIVPDSSGFSEIESAIAEIDGVESVEAGDITLL
ncbi:MAG: elongation factor 1-beta [Candidatus Aenigmatarchaeota archaeon]